MHRSWKAAFFIGCLAGLGMARASACLLQHGFARLQDEKPQDLCQYAGAGIVVVNTASLGGGTPQHRPLEARYASHRSRGLAVLGHPTDMEDPPDARFPHDAERLLRAHPPEAGEPEVSPTLRNESVRGALELRCEWPLSTVPAGRPEHLFLLCGQAARLSEIPERFSSSSLPPSFATGRRTTVFTPAVAFGSGCSATCGALR